MLPTPGRNVDDAVPSGSFRLGPFRLDGPTGELVCGDRKIVLPEKSLSLLLALLERPGRLVTREELRLRLWPDGTLVDFEDGLNHAVRQLRETLGDDAHHPAFVQTLPRRGYRYVGPVVRLDERPGRPAGSWLLAAIGLLALAGATGWLWQWSASGHRAPSLVQLTSYAGRESQPALSPDGRQVAFVWNGAERGNDDLYVQLVGGGPPLCLTSDPADESVPAWSPDGTQIAFRRQSQVAASLHTVSALGGPDRKVVDLGPGRCRLPSLAWTADSRWLVTSEARADGREALVRVSLERGETLPLDGAPDRSETSPALSPDGRHLAYAACTPRWTCAIEVRPVGKDAAPTGPPRRLAEAPSTVYGITWTADGRSVVYSATGPGGSVMHLWRISTSGAASPERLELAGPGALFPSAASAGGRLAYSRTSWDWDVWRAEDGGPAEVFLASTRADANPQFSPDGTRVAFCSNRTTRASSGADTLEIFVAGADGSDPVPLTSGPGAAQCSPQWSPDGRRIAFDSQAADGGYDVFVVDSAGGPPRSLEASPALEHNPSWSRDGRWLYFASNRTGDFEIWRVPAEGGVAVRVTSAGGFFAQESPDGRTLYYVKGLAGGQALFARPTAGGEERRLLDGVRFKSFFVVDEGVYYLAARSDGRPGGEVRFHDFASDRTRVAASVGEAPYFGLSVSPDRRSILFTARRQPDDDVMLIEGFR
jgi:Tol biopolymer transport system component/DNA-binding winged helix-turn-helix (wHTH) protein